MSLFISFFSIARLILDFAADAVARQQGPSLKVLVAGSVVAVGVPDSDELGAQEGGGGQGLPCRGCADARGLVQGGSEGWSRPASSGLQVLLSLPARIISNFVFCFQNSCRVSGRHGPASVIRKPRPCFLCVWTQCRSQWLQVGVTHDLKLSSKLCGSQRASERKGGEEDAETSLQAELGGSSVLSEEAEGPPGSTSGMGRPLLCPPAGGPFGRSP